MPFFRFPTAQVAEIEMRRYARFCTGVRQRPMVVPADALLTIG